MAGDSRRRAAPPIATVGDRGMRRRRDVRLEAPRSVAATRHAHRHRHRLHAAPLLGRCSPPPPSAASASSCPTTSSSRGASAACSPEQLRVCVAETHSDEAILAAGPTRTPSRPSTRWHDGGALHPHHEPPRRARHRGDEGVARRASACAYDELYCSYDKVARCREIGIDVLIDDSPVNIVARHRARGSTAATIRHPWNDDVCEEEEVICADDWPGSRAARAAARARAASTARSTEPATAADERARGGAVQRRTHRRPTRPARPARIEPERQVTDWGRSERVEGLFDRTRRRLPLPLLVPLRGRGHRARARRAAARCSSPTTPARCRPTRAMIAKAIKEEHPRPRPAAPHRRALLQGLPRLLMLLPKIGGVPAHPANVHRLLARRAAARARLPRGPQGHREALQGPLPPAPLRPRRLRRGGDARRARRSSRSRVVGAEEAAPIFAHVPALQRLTGLIYFPITPTFPHFGLLGHARLPARRSSSIRFLAARSRPTTWATSRGRTRRSCRPSPTRSARTIQEELLDMLAHAPLGVVRVSVSRPAAILVTGLSTYWGGRLAQALERDPAVEAIIGVDRTPPKVELERTEYVAGRATQHSLIRRIVRRGRDRHGRRHAPGRRLDRRPRARARTRTTSSGR